MIIKRGTLLLLGILLCLLSLFPRSVEVLNGNPLFGIDNGRDYLAVKSIVIDHKPTLIGAELGAGQAGLSYLFHGPGYFYLLAIPFFLSHGNPAAGVIPLLILGLLSILFGIYFVAKYWSTKEGILVGFFLATSPFLIPQSRFYENHFAATLFILLTFYFIYLFTKYQEKGSSWFIFLASFFCAFIYNFEFAIAIPLGITIMLYSLILFKKRLIFKIPYFLAGFFLGFSPMILFEARHGFLGLRYVFTYLLHPSHTQGPVVPPLRHAGDIINLIIYTFTDSFPGKLLFRGDVLFIVFMALNCFVLVKEKDKLKRNFSLFLLLLFPINFLVFMLLRNIIFEHYFIDLVLANLLLFTFSLGWLSRNGYRKVSVGIMIFLILLFFLAAKNALYTSINDYRDYGGVHKLKGKYDALDFIYKDAHNKPFGLFVFSPEVYTYPYDYLIWWYGQKKYHYIPYKEKKGIFYLLIEEDFQKPWTYKGWEETVIKTGKVVFTKTLPSDFIVEKRVAE